MGSKFEKLIEHPELPVKICEQVMINKMQCPRTAIWLVIPAPAGGVAPTGGGAKASGQEQQQSKEDKGKQTANAPQQHQSGSPASGTTGESKESTGASAGAAASPYQLCNVHKTILEKAEQAASKSGKSVDEEQQKMLGADEPGNLPLQHTPVAPEEAQRAKLEALRIKDEEAKVKKEEEENATAGAGSGKR